MAVITGLLTDVGYEPLTGRQPILRFHPRFREGTLGRASDRLLSGSPVDATITGIGWEADLVPTTGMVPEGWYDLELIELGDEGYPSRAWWWGARVFVPTGGGSFPDLPGGPMSPDSVWVGLTPPPSGWRGYWLYSPAVGETMPLDDPEIGMLRRVRRG